MALLLLTAPVTAKKRHHSKMKNHPITMIDQDTAGVVAYSDTTSLATTHLPSTRLPTATPTRERCISLSTIRTSAD